MTDNRAIRRLATRRSGLRWLHLLLGAALLMPFQVLMTTVVGTTGLAAGQSALMTQVYALALALPLVAAVGLLPVARSLEGAMARTLCSLQGEVPTTAARTWPAKRRTSAWFTLHTLLGGITGAVSLAAPPAGVLLIVMPSLGRDDPGFAWARPAAANVWTAPLLGVALLALPVALSFAAGRFLAALAPRLLGPTPADRLAAAEEHARRMAERARIARELHDSVGHALSAVGVQAAAAARLLRTDPDFAAHALAAIEETARDAVAELDHVLGLLRDSADRTAPPTLAELPALLDRSRAAGAAVEYAEDGLKPALLPGTVSREAYRIVQESLANALKHAGDAPVRMRLTVREDTLEITVTNPLREGHRPRAGGGRGLPGVRDRVALLRGSCVAGPDGAGNWELTARLPLGSSA